MVLRWRVASLVFCTLGASLSADLLRLHVKVHTDPAYHSYCAISEWANCETVAASEYAVFAGLPVALWALAAYLAMGALAVWGLRRPLTPPCWPFGMLFWMSAFSSALSVYLGALSHFVIESVCVVCMGVYLVSFALMGLAYKELRRLELGPLKALAAEIRAWSARPLPLSLFGTVVMAALVVFWVAVPAYWRVEASTGHGGLAVGVTEEGHPWIGARKPKLVITEFSDYQCPHCRLGHHTMKQLIREHPDKVRLVHRHYPLDQECNQQLMRPFHLHACAYARMAFCGQKQNLFWEVNDYLFAKGRRQNAVTPKELAAELKLDARKLVTCLKGGEAAKAVKSDLDAGRALGIRGTPTFVVQGRIYPGRVPEEVLRAALGQ